MRKQEKEVRKKMVVLRMNEAEYALAESFRKKTTEKYLGSYIRKLSLQKPVVIKYRNQSADDFIIHMLELKKELNGIGNNFNQAVHKLHLLEKIPEFRSWIRDYGTAHQYFLQKIDKIYSHTHRLYEQWLLK